MKSRRRVISKVVAVTLAFGLVGCKLKSTNREETPAAPADGVVRYAGQEVAVTGAVVLTASVTARKAAEPSAAPVETLPVGTSVVRRAEFQSFTLVSWSGADGTEHTGWIQSEVVVASTSPATTTGAARPVIKLPKPPDTTQPILPPQKCTGGKVWDGTACSCPSATAWNGSSCVVGGVAGGVAPAQTCTGGKVWDGTACSCPSSTSWNGTSCVAATPTCTGGKVWNGTACACPASTTWNGSSCVAATPTCTGGKVWNGSACACPASTSWNGTSCVAAQTCTSGKVWDGAKCSCPASTAWDGSTCKAKPKIVLPG